MLSSSTTVLTPILKVSFSSFKFKHLIQEIKALFRRLALQSYRRSSFLIAGLIQPLLWLLLFGSLFQKSMFPIFSDKVIYYDDFLGSGIVVFTAFTSSLNAGLPIMFDREFGFFNRLLVVPMTSRLSIVIASFYHIVSITVFQMCTISIITVTKNKIYTSINPTALIYGSLILLLLICLVTIFSIVLAFILSGHIELLALILLINLPILFSSTALAPLNFMPIWLQFVASINPLTYAIESLRYIMIFNQFVLNQKMIFTVVGFISVLDVILYFFILNILTFFLANRFFHRKLE